MSPPSSKRRLSWSSEAGTNTGELSRPRNRWQSVAQQFKVRRRTSLGELFGFCQIRGQEFTRMLLPMLGSMVQRVVSSEMEKGFRQFTTPAPPRLLAGWTQRPRYQLVFMNGLKTVYTMSKVESDEGTAIKLAIVETLENNQAVIVRSGHLSSVKVEVVALHGHFNAKNEESWTPEDFNQHIVSGRERSAQLLTGNLTLKLNGGEAFLENATFTDNSSFTSTKMFRLGLRLLNASERVLEGVTEPFRVKERRVEGFEKHYPPMLDDEVWRLEKIRKNGPYHQALSNEGIYSVQKLLWAYMKDEQKLLKIFSKMPLSTWKSIIGHAMTCKFGDGLYLHEFEDHDAGLFFNAIYKLVGVKFGDCYKPMDQLEHVEKNLVDTLKQVAYQQMGDLQYSYKMLNGQPVLYSGLPALGTSLLSPVLPNNQILNYDISNALGFVSRDSTEKIGIPPGTNNCHSLDSLSSTKDVMSLMQSQFPLPINSESCSNNSIQQCHSQSQIQSQQTAIGFQTSRTNSFDLSCDELMQSFISQIFNSEGTSTPLSPRKWVKIRAAWKLASVGRGFRRLRGPYCPPPKPRLVPTI